MESLGICGWKVNELLGAGEWKDGIYETPLQCPECGCGSGGAANMNDLYAGEQDGSRKVSDVENTMFQNLIENNESK